jgi:glycosyltransferase involved in cell wall biosynthesis
VIGLTMRIDIVFPVLPPALDGIGDHTAQIARRMTSRADVRILTAQSEATPIPGVRIQRAFSVDRPWEVLSLVSAVTQDPPDWLVLQFNQFSYGRWGLNPFLPLALKRLRDTLPDVRIAWMAHEDFVPATSWRFAFMRLWQKQQFLALGRAADHIFFSIEPWVEKYGSWFGDTPVDHFPIGSNIPYTPGNPSVLRRDLGIDQAFVVGFFGSLRARLTDHLQAAIDALQDRSSDVVVLSVGPDGAALQRALSGVQVIDAGRLPAADVSRHLAVMNLHLTPFIDGVSTRRGSFMAGIQHGVPTVATRGELTDRVLQDADGDALLLASTSDPDAFARAASALYAYAEHRKAVGARGQHLYQENFAFDITVPRFLDRLAVDASISDVSTRHHTESLSNER